MIPSEIERLLPKVQKPARYCGGEINTIIKDKSKVTTRVAFCFPDLYEVGMSHLGMKLFYSAFNKREEIWCERVFAPAEDMRSLLLENNMKLYGLESFDPLDEFDVIMFTLQYELCYTGVLDMLYLSGIPLRQKDRKGLENLVMGGGPCACNPEPIADFFDLFFLGEGEEVDLEVLDLLGIAKRKGWSREEFLQMAAQIEGVYVPSLYDITYHEDGTVAAITPKNGASATIKKRIMPDFDQADFPENFVVPFIDVVHDRAVTEVLRGCIRGCRFCQAGYIYRPYRERSVDVINRQAYDLCHNCGYDEVSLSSLSTSDHSHLADLMEKMLVWAEPEHVDLSLPSLRIDSMTPHLLELVQRVRKSGLTFAPEAGSQRLRDAINKNITEQEVLDTCRMSFENGYTAVKLYFMMGLPTETMDDIKGIADTAQQVVDLFYTIPDRPKGKGVQVTISVACFVPKPDTPFQFCAQDRRESLQEKQKYLLSCVHSRKIKVNYHDSTTSVLEGVFAKGDRRLGRVIETAFENGSFFDTWEEYFNYDRWIEAFKSCGIDPDFYNYRALGLDEVTPWDHLDVGVTKAHLVREYNKALEAKTTQPCNRQCSACGANKLIGGPCFDYSKNLL